MLLAFAAALGSLLTYALVNHEPNDNLLKIYIGTATLIATATASFISGRVISEIADRRAVRRKLHVAHLRLVTVEYRIERLIEALARLREAGADIKGIGDTDVREYAPFVTYIRAVCSEVPSFDDLLESGEDFGQAFLVTTVFHEIQERFPSQAPSVDAMQAWRSFIRDLMMGLGTDDDWLARVLAELRRAIEYFRWRIAGL